MVPDQYSESVSIADVKCDIPEEKCLTICDLSSQKRCKTSLTIDPSLCPINYRDSLVCYTDTTKRRYRSTVHYEPRLRPRTFSDGCYIRPKRPESMFASLLDHKPSKTSDRKWFSAAVHFNKVKDIVCSQLSDDVGMKVNGTSNGHHHHDVDDEMESKEHHGGSSSMRVKANVNPNHTYPGEQIILLATEGRQPAVTSDGNQTRKNPITCGSYKMCWNGDNGKTACDGQINRSRIKIDGANGY